MSLRLLQGDGGVVLKIKAVPGASRDRVVGILGDALKVAVSAPPEKGRANKRILEVLAEALGLPRRQFELVAGTTSAEKTVRVLGTTVEELREALDRVLQHG